MTLSNMDGDKLLGGIGFAGEENNDWAIYKITKTADGNSFLTGYESGKDFELEDMEIIALSD